MEIKINSIYKHYKGGLYRVLALGQHTETLEELVVYQALYGDNAIWCRPSFMWNDEIEFNGKITKRFELIEENNG